MARSCYSQPNCVCILDTLRDTKETGFLREPTLQQTPVPEAAMRGTLHNLPWSLCVCVTRETAGGERV